MRNESDSKPNTETRSRDAISPDVGEATAGPTRSETLKYSYRDLSPENQALARSRFINAGPGDAYLYELNMNGALLSRRHIHFDFEH